MIFYIFQGQGHMPAKVKVYIFQGQGHMPATVTVS